MNDQIIEVDGISLVGVTQTFAASALRNNSGRIRFLIGREKVSENSEIAHLISQSLEAERKAKLLSEQNSQDQRQAPEKALPSYPSTQSPTLPGYNEHLEVKTNLNISSGKSYDQGCLTQDSIDANDLNEMKKEISIWKEKYCAIKDEYCKYQQMSDSKCLEMRNMLEDVQVKLHEKEVSLSHAVNGLSDSQKLIQEFQAKYSLLQKKYYKSKKIIKDCQERLKKFGYHDFEVGSNVIDKSKRGVKSSSDEVATNFASSPSSMPSSSSSSSSLSSLINHR